MRGAGGGVEERRTPGTCGGMQWDARDAAVGRASSPWLLRGGWWMPPAESENSRERGLPVGGVGSGLRMTSEMAEGHQVAPSCK